MWLSCIPWSNNTMKQEFPISFGNDDESWRLLYQYFLLIKKLWSFLIAKPSWCLEPRELKLKFGWQQCHSLCLANFCFSICYDIFIYDISTLKRQDWCLSSFVKCKISAYSLCIFNTCILTKRLLEAPMNKKRYNVGHRPCPV